MGDVAYHHGPEKSSYLCTNGLLSDQDVLQKDSYECPEERMGPDVKE